MLLTFTCNPFRGLDMPILVDPFGSPLYFEPKRKKLKGWQECQKKKAKKHR
jgi:hypothetical protein